MKNIRQIQFRIYTDKKTGKKYYYLKGKKVYIDK